MMKRILALILCAVMCLGTLSSLTGCGKNDTVNGEETTDSSVAGETTGYSVTVSSTGGVNLEGIDVYVYTDEALSSLVGYAKTGADGVASLDIPQFDNYFIVLSGAPKGYSVERFYKFDGNTKSIVLSTSLVTGEDLSTAKLTTGDVMYDFTVTNAKDGSTIKLSDVLKEKKMVMLNFWYTTCTWCLKEFPLMNTVYGDYKDDIEIIALNPMEDTNIVKGFQAEYGYDFPMAACPASWSNVFGISGYPTSIFIDRNGVICLVESGAITSKRPFVCAFDHFTADDYQQKLCASVGDLVTQVEPSFTMPESDVIANLVNNGDIAVSYRAETEDENAKYIWPFIEGEKLGNPCLYASNSGYDSTYSILYADVTLKAGQAFGFDYLTSSERFNDALLVIVDGEDIFQISGINETEAWQSCYPIVADKDGTYEVAFCFMKDSDTSEGDDTVYLDNFRVIDNSAIDVDTYLPRHAAQHNEADDSYTYVDIVFNEKDGYYHVGTADGPYLLADLMNYTQFVEEKSVYDIVYNGEADKDGVSLYNKKAEGGLGMVEYFSYASNATLDGICTVNAELCEMLKQVAEVAGFGGDENEWLKICKYFESYGPNATQLDDPIRGLGTHSTFTATLGKDIPTNYFYYDRAIIPRGLLAKFVPEVSGVYRFTSKSDYEHGIDAWIFTDDGIVYTFEHEERMLLDDKNCSMVYYMEAGKAYYINMAYWDVYQTGYIYYDVEFIGETFELFRMASPGYFTYNTDATGENIYAVIAGGIEPVLGADGFYHDPTDGSIVYADFAYTTGIFTNKSIMEMVQLGAFDFSKTETDGEILGYLADNGGDVDATIAYLKEFWGEDYDENYEIYMVDDILAGRYHGVGEDYTEEMRGYVAKMITEEGATFGCVPVDERLAEILQLLVSKYTFENVDHSWTKVCYYFDYLGPAK